MDEKEIYEICSQVDNFIADRLTESIVKGTSYDMLEAHYGILPISRNCFYRKRRIAQNIIRKRAVRLEEDKYGKIRIEWGQNEKIQNCKQLPLTETNVCSKMYSIKYRLEC